MAKSPIFVPVPEVKWIELTPLRRYLHAAWKAIAFEARHVRIATLEDITPRRRRIKSKGKTVVRMTGPPMPSKRREETIRRLRSGYLARLNHLRPAALAEVLKAGIDYQSAIRTFAEHFEAVRRLGADWPRSYGTMDDFLDRCGEETRIGITLREWEQVVEAGSAEPTGGTKWSKPMSPKELARTYGLSWDTIKRRIKTNAIRVKKLSEKSYQVHRDDLPQT